MQIRLLCYHKNKNNILKDIYNRDTEYIPNGTNLMDIIPADIIKEKYGLTKKEVIYYFFQELFPERD